MDCILASHVPRGASNVHSHFPDVKEAQGREPGQHCEHQCHTEYKEDKADPQLPAERVQEGEGICAAKALSCALTALGSGMSNHCEAPKLLGHFQPELWRRDGQQIFWQPPLLKHVMGSDASL